MNFKKIKIGGAWVVELDHLGDNRGFFARAWCRDEFGAQGITAELSQANLSFCGQAGTLRGMHFQRAPYSEMKAVLDGAERVLDDPILHSVIIELNGSGGRYGFDENEIMEGMLARGFRPYSYEPFGRQLIELQGANQERGNTLLVRNKGEVEKKLKRAPPFNVHGRKV